MHHQIPVDAVGYIFIHNQGYEQNLRSMMINEWKIGTVNVSDVAEKRGVLVNRVDGIVKEWAWALHHLDVTDVQLTSLDDAQTVRDAQAQGLQRKVQIEAHTIRITTSG